MQLWIEPDASMDVEVNPSMVPVPWGQIFAMYQERSLNDKVELFISMLLEVVDENPTFREFRSYCESALRLEIDLVRIFKDKAREKFLGYIDTHYDNKRRRHEDRKLETNVTFRNHESFCGYIDDMDQDESIEERKSVVMFRVFCYIAGGCVHRANFDYLTKHEAHDLSDSLFFCTLKDDCINQAQLDYSRSHNYKIYRDVHNSYSLNTEWRSALYKATTFSDQFDISGMMKIERQIYLGYSGSNVEQPEPRSCPTLKILDSISGTSWDSFRRNEFRVRLDF